MDLVKGAIGGVVGGAIGAVVWALIAYSAHVESGWIAWGIGFLVGFGVTLGCGGKGGAAAGGLAILIALGSIVCGKYVAVQMMVRDITKSSDQQIDSAISDDDIFLDLVRNAAKQLENDGKTLQYKNNKNSETAAKPEDFPEWLVKDRHNYFDALTSDERAQLRKVETDKIHAVADAVKGEVTRAGFEASFSPFDILWGLLAILTAWRVGAGGS
ncbi:MAG: hypothetical protein QM783_16825 [Phycisphaerales bacterium]